MVAKCEHSVTWIMVLAGSTDPRRRKSAKVHVRMDGDTPAIKVEGKMSTALLWLLRVKGGKADCGHEDLAHHDHLGFRAGRVHHGLRCWQPTI